MLIDAAYRLLTPTLPGAIAVIELCGADAHRVLGRRFRTRSGKAGQLPTAGTLRVGTLVDNGVVLDDVVLAAPAPNRFEIATHAGPAVVARVVGALSAAGAKAAPAAAPTLLERAQTWLAAKVCAWVESGELDGSLSEIREVVDRLLIPHRVVLVGAPNAGKSTLFNALLELDETIVSSQAGTTRDAIWRQSGLCGVPVALCDTAGIGPEAGAQSVAGMGGDHELEAMAQQRTLETLGEAQTVLLCVDRHAPRPAAVAELFMPDDERVVWVWTKGDLLAANDNGKWQPQWPSATVSVHAKQGTDDLALHLAHRALGCDPGALSKQALLSRGGAQL